MYSDMNPFSWDKPFRKGRNAVSNANKARGRISRRSTKNFKLKSAKLKESIGVIETKDKLKCALLNTDGLQLPTLSYVRSTLLENPVDICILLETKRRLEETNFSIDVDGYNVQEYRRSDAAGDRGGGGIAIYTKKGTLFTEHQPKIDNPDHLFVNNERVWRIIHSAKSKTAVCAVYAGFQAADNRHSTWNDILFSVLKSEIADLRRAGYRVVLLGDMNSHVGSAPGVGIQGNHASINRNGIRFLDFLKESHCTHINGIQDVTKGLWTWQRGGLSTVLDYAVVSSEHISSVKSMFIDDRGCYGTGSDHNWIFLTLNDLFKKKVKISNLPSKCESWNMKFDQDWSTFQSKVDELVDQIDLKSNCSTEALALTAAKVLKEAGIEDIGFRSSFSSTSHKASRLPWSLVSELKVKLNLEREWKAKTSNFNSLPISQQTASLKNEVLACERAYLDQKHKVSSLFFLRKQASKQKILRECSGNSSDAKRKFWTYISKSVKKPGEIDLVVSAENDLHYSSPDDIIDQVEGHLLKVFNGSRNPIAPVDIKVDVNALDHPYAKQTLPTTNSIDHCYAESPSPKLPSAAKSSTIGENPGRWLDRDFTLKEVKYAVKKLKTGKAIGFDCLPNEFIINAGVKFWSLLVVLYNKVKSTGNVPSWWKEGRITLVHKGGPRERLDNYRPLTVINSLSGLFSRLLNERLTAVVEKHRLLGEIQNGFRMNRSAEDNCFIMKTILWKQNHFRRKVHMAFVDLSKVWCNVLSCLTQVVPDSDLFFSHLLFIVTGNCSSCSSDNSLIFRPFFAFVFQVLSMPIMGSF